MGRERRPRMSTPLPRPREARKAARGKTREASQRSSKATISGVSRVVTMEDCQKKAAGKPHVPKSLRGPDPKPKGKGKGGKGKKRRPLTSSHTVRTFSRLMRKPSRRLQERDWQAWERIQKQAQNQWKSYKSGNLCANAVGRENRFDD